MRRSVPVTKKGYVSPVRTLACDLQAVRRGAGATTQTLQEREAKLSQWDQKAWLLAEEARPAGVLQKRLVAKTGNLK